MSFLRHITESMETKKTEAEISTSAHAIGLSYSSLSCSPAEPNSAWLNKSNVENLNSTVYFTLPNSLQFVVLAFIALLLKRL